MQISKNCDLKPGRKSALEMTEVMKLADKNFKTAIVNVIKDLKENMTIMREME